MSNNQLFRHEFPWFTENFEEGKKMLETAANDLCKQYVFNYECGKEEKNYHFQVYFNLKVKLRCTELAKKLLVYGIKVSIRPVHDEYAVDRYCQKSDTRIHGPFGNINRYLGQDLIQHLRPWQQQISDMIQVEPHPRSIYWYYDSVGGKGKTSFSKYMYFHHKIITLTIGKASDLLNLVSKMEKQRCYIFDISRTIVAGAMQELYMAIESVKNGYFVNTKYQTDVCCFAIPHVIIFSNMLPKLSALSSDRWIINDMENV